MSAFQKQLAKVYETLKQANWIKLSHQIDAESPHFPALPALEQKDLFTLKDGFHVQQLSVVTQYGTRIDPPCHFYTPGSPVRAIAYLPEAE